MENIFTVCMPDIGEGVVEGEVIKWLKKTGEELAQDEPVVVVMTDKATVELPAPYPGKLAKQYVQPGQNAIKGKPLYDIELVDEASLPKPSASIQESGVAPVRLVDTTTVSSQEVRSASATPLATPPIRKLARDLQLNLQEVRGTGPEGRITLEDLRHHLGSQQTATPLNVPNLPGDDVRPLQGIRRLTARHVAMSKATIPHFTYCDHADVSQLVQLRTKLLEEAHRRGIRLTFTPFFIRALSLTLKQFPDCNGSFDSSKDALVIHSQQNIGIAMKTPLGLIVPVLQAVNTLTFEQTVVAYEALRARALENKLKPQDMHDATITLSNFGTEGGRWATPVINAPQVAILATARIHQEPSVRGGQIVVRDVLNCSWSFDHRVIDGDLAAALSNAFIKFLENPAQLM